MKADLVIPSLDAGDESVFRQVNRPREELTFEKLVDGLAAFRREFGGQYWLEVFLLAGLNATDAHMAKMAECASRIEPDRVQLNTVTRPPAEQFAKPVPQPQMVEFAAMFDPPGEVIASFRRKSQEAELAGGMEAVLQLLHRRPCRLQDISDGLGMHPNEVLKYVQRLQAEGLVTSSRIGSGELFHPVR